MTIEIFLPLLALGTIGIVAFFALRSKRDVEARKQDPNAEKSPLAADAPSHKRPTD